MKIPTVNESFAMKRRTNTIFDVLAGFLRDKSGSTVIEYTLIASIISVGILTSAGTLGTTVQTLYTNVADQVSAAME